MIDGRVRDDNACLLRPVGCPVLIDVDDIADILPPDEAMERAQILNVKAGRLLQDCSHLRPVLADDVGIVSSCLIQVISVKIDLIREQGSVQRAEGAERVCGEQDAAGRIIGHHDLRPVDHRSIHERQCMRAAAEGVPFLHDLRHAIHVKCEILLHHDSQLLVADDLHIRVAADKLFKSRAVVRLHMMDHDIVKMAAVQAFFNILKKHGAHSRIDRIKEYSLLVKEQIRVVGDSSRYRIDSLKHRQAPVIRADPEQVLCHISEAIHIFSFLS